MKLYFDRGTIVIEAGVTECLPDYFVWDSRVNRWRAAAYHLTDFLESLASKNVEWKYESPRPEDFYPQRSTKVPKLRPYQKQALEAWTACGRRGVVNLPTGSGKTRLAIRALLSSGRSTLVIVPTRPLLHQWKAQIQEFYGGPVGLYGDGQRQAQPITVATYESAYIYMDSLGDHFDLMVIDEAHHFTSERLAEVVQMSTAEFRLGLTATLPEETEKKEFLEAVVGPICFALPITTLAGTYLSSFEQKRVSLHLTATEQGIYEHYRSTFLRCYRPFMVDHPSASWDDFVKAARRSPSGREALIALRRSRELLSLPQCKIDALDQLLDCHAEDQTLVFTLDNRSAYEISRRFLIPAVTCEIEGKERQRILDRFRDSTYTALVSARVLNEGIDVPAASVAIIVGGSSNPGQHVQRIGRVLRPVPEKESTIYEFVVLGTSDWFASQRRNNFRVPAESSSLPHPPYTG